MDFLKDVWSGLVSACQWLLHSFKQHPVVSVLVLGALVYGWWLSLKKKLREQKNAKRESAITKCLEEITALDLHTKGGLRSQVQPSPGEDPAIVAEAWERFVAKRRTGEKGRF